MARTIDPSFLFVHHPNEDRIYWVDITHHVESRGDDPLGASYIEFSKSNQLDAAFETYLHERFDLVTYSESQYADLRCELESLVHSDGSGGGTVCVSALDLFVEGLWGLCSKLQFHSSLLADIIRKAVRDREGAIPITYTFDRAALYPFFTRYFSLLTKHHLALIDSADINNSLYAKLEYPAFIAVLTTNGRRFVEYLRSAGHGNVHDNQFLSLTARPHVQIEVYSSFELIGGRANFGPFTDVLAIRFNPYLDYYELTHVWRTSREVHMVEVIDQTVHYHELREYIANRFDNVDKDNFLFRYLDVPLSPLICWLENWNPNSSGMPTEELRGKSVTEWSGFHDEMMATLPGSATVSEPPEIAFPLPVLASGERLVRTTA